MISVHVRGSSGVLIVGASTSQLDLVQRASLKNGFSLYPDAVMDWHSIQGGFTLSQITIAKLRHLLLPLNMCT